jgi:hypothetical protein
LGVKRTLAGLASMSASDPKRTFPIAQPTHFQPAGLLRYDA